MTDVKSSIRRSRSAATRAKVLRAAHAEFLERGFHGATIATIATRAGVATQTVYFVFHTKAQLISAVIDGAVMGSDPPTTPQQTAWWSQMQKAGTATESLRAFIRGAAPLFQRAGPISDILRAAALTDDEVKATYDMHERMRRSGFREVIETVSTKGALKEGLTVDTATDALMVVFGDTSYVLLTQECGWTHEQAVEWFCQAIPDVLLRPSSENRSPR